MTWILHSWLSDTRPHPSCGGLLHSLEKQVEPPHNIQLFCCSLALSPEANKLKIEKRKIERRSDGQADTTIILCGLHVPVCNYTLKIKKELEVCYIDA